MLAKTTSYLRTHTLPVHTVYFPVVRRWWVLVDKNETYRFEWPQRLQGALGHYEPKSFGSISWRWDRIKCYSVWTTFGPSRQLASRAKAIGQRTRTIIVWTLNVYWQLCLPIFGVRTLSVTFCISVPFVRDKPRKKCIKYIIHKLANGHSCRDQV